MSSKGVSFSAPETAEAPAKSESAQPNELFHNIASVDFLGFSFNGKSYESQLKEAVASTGKFCAVTVEIRTFAVRHLFGALHQYLYAFVTSNAFNLIFVSTIAFCYSSYSSLPSLVPPS